MEMNFRFTGAIAAATLLSLGLAGCRTSQSAKATAPPPAPLFTATDSNFVNQAEQIDTRDTDLGNLALKKAKEPAVKNYARMIVNDRSDDLKKLNDLIKKEEITPQKAAEPPELKDLAKLSGRTFDKKFTTLMAQLGEKDLDQFKKEANETQDPNIRAYAQNDQSSLETDIQRAQDLEGTSATKQKK